MPQQHAVLVHFRFDGSDLQPLYELEEKLTSAIEAQRAGEFDGDEVATDGSHEATLYMYGPDADRLFEVVRPILEATPFMRGASVIKRYGPPADGTREFRVKLGQ